jgi:hypothetical protein
MIIVAVGADAAANLELVLLSLIGVESAEECIARRWSGSVESLVVQTCYRLTWPCQIVGEEVEVNRIDDTE